ncbi:MAG: Ig-like domain-containing protein [Elainellaceae cyanobacterium]
MRTPSKLLSHPLDRAAVPVILALAVVLTLVVLFVKQPAPTIREFSWQDKLVGAEDQAFFLTFSRPMDHEAVEENLALKAVISEADEQPIPGKVSWAGRRMAFTLLAPAPYGYTYTLTLDEAWDRFSTEAADESHLLVPFEGRFRTRDRAFLYLGASGDEEGRLILYNLTRKEKRVLTPETLTVLDYEPYPNGDRVLFSAVERAARDQGPLNQQLYVAATGIEAEAPAATPGAKVEAASFSLTGDVQLLLDSDDYQNLKFDLSPDGQTVVVYRVNRQTPSDFGLWTLRSDEAGNPTLAPLPAEPGGDFLITPDSQAIAYLQGQGMALLSLDEETAAEPIDFLPQYGLVLDFALDGTAAALVRFDADPTEPTQSLFVVTNQGKEQNLLSVPGSIVDAQFSPTGDYLYSIVTERLPGDVYAEQPYLVAIDLNTGDRSDLLLLPVQSDIKMSLAPDGLGILFDQVATAVSASPSGLRSADGNVITGSALWFFPILFNESGVPLQTEPNELPTAGFYPQWLP